MTRRHTRRNVVLFTGLFAASALAAFLSNASEPEATAATLDKFDPGNIISDYMMGNYTSMTEAEIQQFLTSKNSCQNKSRALYDEMVAAYGAAGYTWHWKDDHFVCLSEELFGDGEVIGEGETAAHIIWQAANDYKINPQVILVLLQKETSLITDSYPNNRDYRKATGYGCPDTAACSEKYYGFKNQIRNAAALFSTVLNGGWTNFPLGENYIQYNPNAACGGSVVNIKSLATSALYRYTPYQPNAGAIAAGYGTAECGAYGNRNFYLYFSDWFGDPTVARAKYEKLKEAKVYEVISATEKIDPFAPKADGKKGAKADDGGKGTEEETNPNALKAGQQITVVEKILAADGECYRTKEDFEKNQDLCVLSSQLKEVNPTFKNIPANEQQKIIKAGAIKRKILTDEEVEKVSDTRIVRKIVKEATLNGKKYYITEYDSKQSIIGISEEYILDMPKYENLKSPIYMELTSDAKRINPFDETVYDSLKKGRVLKFASTIKVGDEVYYRTEHNTKNNIDAVLPASAVKEIKYEILKEPEYRQLTAQTKRINPYTNEVYDTLSKGRVLKFTSTITINDKVYYRTEHNTKNDIDAVLPATSSKEFGYEDFQNPRKLKVIKKVERINPKTGKIYDTIEAGRIIEFASKIELADGWYYRTKHNTTNNIDAVLPASAVTEVN